MSAPTFKRTPEDFVVEELPAHAPTGDGQHLWLWVEKRGLSTPAALVRLGRALDLPRRRLRAAGLKDARAVTRQWVSVDRPPADAAARLERLGEAAGEGPTWVRVLEAVPSRRGLSKGQLRGNRFRVRLRGEGDLDALRDRAAATLARLAAEGAPNRYGLQRFGSRGDSARVGEALVRGRHDEAAALFLGRPTERDHGRWLEAREAFERGDLAAARAAWPRDQDGPRRLLAGLAAGEPAEVAWGRVDRRLVELLGNAWQAELFNAALDRRLADHGGLVELLPGDLALRLPLGRKAFAVEDLERERERARAGEVTASGPLFGPAMPWPGGAPGALEEVVLAEAGWSRADLAEVAALPRSRAKAWPGGRRGLRLTVTLPAGGGAVDTGRDDAGPWLELRFELPKGGYATTVLAELGVEGT